MLCADGCQAGGDRLSPRMVSRKCRRNNAYSTMRCGKDERRLPRRGHACTGACLFGVGYLPILALFAYTTESYAHSLFPPNECIKYILYIYPCLHKRGNCGKAERRDARPAGSEIRSSVFFLLTHKLTI